MKNLTNKDIAKMAKQMGITTAKHDRPPVGRPTVFYGKTNKQKRQEGKMMVRDY